MRRHREGHRGPDERLRPEPGPGPDARGTCRGPRHEDWGGSGKRFFGRGYVKYALLELLEQQAMHGYQMMKSLEERSNGAYSASAGSIYPTLQMMEDRDWIAAEEVDGKKTYRLTDAGIAELQAWRGRDSQNRPRQESDNGVSPRERRLSDSFELLRLLTKAEKRAAYDPAYADQLQRYLDNSLNELRSLVFPGRSETSQEEKHDAQQDDQQDSEQKDV